MLILAVVWAALAAAPAAADDTYDVYTCRGPSGQPAAPDGWTFGGRDAARRSDCTTGGEIAAGPTLTPYNHEGFTWQFTAPADTRITAWTLYRTVSLSKDPGGAWGWNWNLTQDAPVLAPPNHVEMCWAVFQGCPGLGDGAVSDASKVGRAGVDVGSVHAIIDCNPFPCPAGSPVSMRIHRADFTLRDSADPALAGVPSGDLFDTTRPLAGVRGASFSATDKGGGVYQATIEIDGQPMVTRTVDENGGRCAKPFTAAAPCRQSASGSISFDTATLPDGPHKVRLLVSDPTETNVAAFGPVEIRTQNRSPECDPGVRPASSPVTSAFARTRRRTITRRSARSLQVTGRIAGVGGGVAVHLLSRELRSGAPAELTATAVTAPDGSFALGVPAGPSRRLRAAYRVRSTDPFLVCSRPLNLHVRARATLTASPRRVRPGGRVRLSGRLLGGHVPRRGKLVDLEAYDGGRWRDFATVRANARGRFATSYRFSRGARRRTYPIRVRVRPDSSYPFALGYSPAVRVRVR